jgi:signal transduction histidine kinase
MSQSLLPLDPLRSYALDPSLPQDEAFRAMLEGMLDAIYILHSVRDSTGAIVDFAFVYVNRAGEIQMQTTREAMVGQLMCELYPINRTHGFFERYKRVVETGETLEQEYRIPSDAAGTGWWYHQVVKLGDGISIVNRDITARKQLEARLVEQERAVTQVKTDALNQLKNEMMLRIAHEFRTPLTRIGLSGDILERYLDRLTSEQVAARVHDMKSEIMRLESMLSALNFAVVGEGERGDHGLSQVDICAIVRDIAARVRLTIPAPERLRISCPPLPDLRTDPYLLDLIVVNLIGNAIKFSAADGGICVEIDGAAEGLMITVSDEGIGILPTDMPHIFDPFFRGHNFDETSGLGIGLTLVKNAVVALKGQIAVMSASSGSETCHQMTHDGQVSACDAIFRSHGTTIRIILPASWMALDD